MKKLVSVINNQVTTTSKQIADVFGKRHSHVLRDIQALEIPKDFRESNFGLSSYKAGKRSYSMYDLTFDGFTVLVMGYSGKKAMEFKVKYIKAFRAMEAKLRERQQIVNARPAICENGRLRYLHPELGMLSPVMKEIKECCQLAIREELRLYK